MEIELSFLGKVQGQKGGDRLGDGGHPENGVLPRREAGFLHRPAPALAVKGPLPVKDHQAHPHGAVVSADFLHLGGQQLPRLLPLLLQHVKIR